MKKDMSHLYNIDELHKLVKEAEEIEKTISDLAHKARMKLQGMKDDYEAYHHTPLYDEEEHPTLDDIDGADKYADKLANAWANIDECCCLIRQTILFLEESK